MPTKHNFILRKQNDPNGLENAEEEKEKASLSLVSR